jgi:hypothetical protein
VNKNVIRFGFLIPLFLFAIACSSFLAMAADTPSVDTVKQVLDQQLQKLRPVGTTERNVLFEAVRAGTPNAGLYPFQVTLSIRDYGPGYPANRYYGETCVGHMDKEPFDLHRNAFGEWQADGRMSILSSDGRQCKPNPSAGVSSIPLASLPGSPAPSGPTAAPPPPARAAGKNAGLPTGEWACYGTGNSILFGFFLQPGGTYLDGDKKPAGTYKYDSAAGTISFRGGSMGGQVGKHARGRHFDLSETVSCESTI